MPVYAYQVVDRRQQLRNGTIAADNPASARQALREQGLTLTWIAPLAPPAGQRWRRWGQHRLLRDLPDLWGNLALLLRAGVPLLVALDVCGRQQGRGLRSLLQALRESVRSGQPLATALAAYPALFDRLTLALVDVGQRSGALADALDELADYQRRRQLLTNRLSAALLYPAILLLVGTGVVVFLLSYVVPQLIAVLTAAGRELPAPTRLLMTLSAGLVTHGPVLLILLLGGAVALTVARTTARGKRGLERVILAIPLVGGLVRRNWVARISMMLATLLRADARFVEALRTVRTGLPHVLYAAELADLERAVEAGAGLGPALRNSRLIPPLVVHLLAVGQESGALPQMLERVRQGYEQEVQRALTRLLAVLEPGLILLLAGVIGFVVYATILPILETTRIVQ